MWNNKYQAASADSVRDFMYKVYGWMSCALAITAGVAYGVASTPEIMGYIIKSPILFIGLALAQLGLVIFLSARIQTLDYATAVTTFLAYSALSGVTFSIYFYVYTLASIYLAFGITSGMFLSMALYGYFTKSDLSSMGSYLRMGLFGIIIAMLMNIFFQSPAMSYYISLAAVGIFTLLTAYDTQKIKTIAQSPTLDLEGKKKIAVLGALTLYLDFINLFIHLLRLFGKKRN